MMVLVAEQRTTEQLQRMESRATVSQLQWAIVNAEQGKFDYYTAAAQLGYRHGQRSTCASTIFVRRVLSFSMRGEAIWIPEE
jgi:hypothetical protein